MFQDGAITTAAAAAGNLRGWIVFISLVYRHPD
jgi:hypothetical protein